jgi:formate dehydrogenase iron-sulfur subunit
LQPTQGKEVEITSGFFTDTSVCIGCKACEVACKQWNQLPMDGTAWAGTSYDNTKQLGATTWRHVTFAELPGSGGAGGQTSWMMMSDVCKHCTHAGCLEACPTGAIIRTEFDTVVVQQDVCNGCGYCVPACPFGVIDLDVAGPGADGKAHKCTLCYDRLADGLEPACAKACPTDSIQFGDLDELRARAQERVWKLRGDGLDARLYGDDSLGGTEGIGELHSLFLLLDRPQTYNLPERPTLPQDRTLPGVLALGAAALVLAGATAFSLWKED